MTPPELTEADVAAYRNPDGTWTITLGEMWAFSRDRRLIGWRDALRAKGFEPVQLAPPHFPAEGDDLLLAYRVAGDVGPLVTAVVPAGLLWGYIGEMPDLALAERRRRALERYVGGFPDWSALDDTDATRDAEGRTERARERDGYYDHLDRDRAGEGRRG